MGSCCAKKGEEALPTGPENASGDCNNCNSCDNCAKNREITLEELAKHNTRQDAWVSIRGKVYDVTGFIDKHPGGVSAIMKGVGTEATELFESVPAHRNINPERSTQLGKQIGTLKGYQKD